VLTGVDGRAVQIAMLTRATTVFIAAPIVMLTTNRRWIVNIVERVDTHITARHACIVILEAVQENSN